jgi:hypothetical protein
VEYSIVLALVVRHPKSRSISVIPLSSEFTFKVIPREPGKRIGPFIEVLPIDEGLQPSVRLPVTSLTVAYGENGEGKTRLLLDVCRTLNLNSRHRPLGTIWRDKRGVVRFDPGDRMAAVRLTGPSVTSEATPSNVHFGSVFYTTSPFESARRRETAAEGTIDVTPSFDNNAFNGTSLCLAAGSLPKDIDFIKPAKVNLEFEVTHDLQTEIEDFIATLDRLGFLRHRRSQTPLHSIDTLLKLTEGLNQQSRSLLAIALRRARLAGEKETLGLYEDLVDPESFNAVQDWTRKLIELRESKMGWGIPSRLIQNSLKKLSKDLKSSKPRDLSGYADLLQSLPEMTLAGIQEAENIGLLRWRFLELSSGQVALLMLFASLGSALANLRSRSVPHVVLVIDEGEMFMHPAWQRKYLQDVMNFIKYYSKSFEGIHVVMATHSLIVAGDTPPYRLFDVKSGEMRNGFAYGPKEVLTDVYGVEEFAGNLAEELYDKIVSALRAPDAPTPDQEEEVRALIKQIASPQLKTYLLEELQRRRLHKYA